MDPTCTDTQQRYTDYAGALSNKCTTRVDCISAVRAGDQATCALKSDGSVWCWGGGKLTPVRVELPVDGAAEIALGGAGLCVRDRSHAVYCASSPFDAMTMIPQPASIGITAGKTHACAVTSDNHVACWGMNQHGQLGGGDVGGGHQPSATPVIALNLSDVSQVSAGVDSTCAVTSSGSVSCWGDDSSGQAGCGLSCFGDDTAPEAVSGPEPASSVTAGDQSACARTTAGEVWCWGGNHNGELGDPMAGDESDVPHRIPPQALSGITGLSSAGGHTCALGAGGVVSCWGRNESHQVSGAAASTVALPSPVVDDQGAALRFSDVASGTSHTCGLSMAGVVRCWGSNASGQIGDGSMVAAASPTTARLGCP
jgi:alpha-tubulin suppressor-like RCC1 family protein